MSTSLSRCLKSEKIRPLFRQTVNLLNQFESWNVHHITREKNFQADNLVNQALDLQQDIEIQAPKTAKPKTSGPRQKPLRLGVLISGGGTTLTNILKYINNGRLNAEDQENQAAPFL